MNRIPILIIILLLATNAYSLRMGRPFTLKHPIDEEQISQLNKFLEEIWLMQNGRYEMDIVTTTKTSSNPGEVYIIQTGAISSIQWRANGRTYTIRADGY